MDDAGTALLRHLTDSGSFGAFERDFSRATGLPVHVLDRSGRRLSSESGVRQSGVCGLVESESRGCELCKAARGALSQGAQSACGSAGAGAECPAGLHEQVLPIRVGNEILGFLQTGQVLLRAPSEAGFERLLAWLEGNEVPCDREALRSAYFSSAVLGRAEYEAMLGLLRFGVETLEKRSAEMLQAGDRPFGEQVTRACRFLRENLHEPIPLAAAARAAGLSRHHFCRVFRKETGHSFTEYLALLRVHAAAERLRTPGVRVSEVALAVGFQSISQFNRSFRQVMGVPPSAWRASLFNAGPGYA